MSNLGIKFFFSIDNKTFALGPYKYIEDILTSSMCNKNLMIGPSQAHFESNVKE